MVRLIQRVQTSNSPLIARRDVLDQAASALRADVPLLTITGPGGVGKTRLALELSEHLETEFPDGAVLIDLATISDPSDLDVEFAKQLGLRARDRVGLQQRVDGWLAGNLGLVILDNAEHVLEVSERVVEWLQINPAMRIIVTSRHALNISWEYELVLEPLATRLDVPPEALYRPSPAATLYLAAADVNDTSDLSPDDLLAVEDLCMRLDGLPLAIELVARRLKSCRAEDIQQAIISGELEDAADAVVNTALESAFDWSYQLLSADAQRLLRYLSVFVDGFTVEVAELQMRHACLDEPQQAVMPPLDELVDHHLVVHARRSQPERPVFRMLDLIQHAALRRLRDRGEEPDARSAHARAMSDYALARRHAGQRPGREHEVRELDEQFHDLLSALEWFRDRDDGASLQTLVAALWWLWYAHGFYGIGLAWIKEVERRSTDRESLTWGVIQMSHGQLLSLQGEAERANACFDAAWTVFDGREPLGQRATLCVLQAITLAHLHRFDQSLQRLRQALECAAGIESKIIRLAIESASLQATGTTLHEAGELEQAEVSIRSAIDVLEGSDYHWGLGRSWCDLSDVLRDRSRPAEAIEGYQRAIVHASAINDHRILAGVLAGLATALSDVGQATLAAWVWGAVDAQTEAADGHASLYSVKTRAFERSRSDVKQRLGAEAFERTRSDGASTALPDVVARIQAMQIGSTADLVISEAVASRLTAREREVLQLLVQAVPTRTIASTLGITERTVSAHIGSLLKKFGVTSRLELIAETVAAPH